MRLHKGLLMVIAVAATLLAGCGETISTPTTQMTTTTTSQLVVSPNETATKKSKSTTAQKTTAKKSTERTTTERTTTERTTTITAQQGVAIDSLYIDGSSEQTCFLGKTLALEIDIYPENATETVQWTSSNSAVATVSQSGVVTGVSVGSAVITVTTPGGEDAAVKIIVKEDVTNKCSLTIPALPKTVSHYNYNDSIRDSFKITDIAYKFEESYEEGKVRLTLYFTGEKTYDEDGAGQGRACEISWRIIDSEGYVIESGTHNTEALRMGEKVKKSEEEVYYDFDPGAYTLEVSNTN